MKIWKPALIAALCLSQGLKNAYAAPTNVKDTITDTALPRLRGAIRDLEEIPDPNQLVEDLDSSIELSARRLGSRDNDDSASESLSSENGNNGNNENNKLDNIANILQSILDRLEILTDINRGIGHVKDEAWEIHQGVNQLVADGD